MSSPRGWAPGGAGATPGQPTYTRPITGAYDAATPSGDVFFRANIATGASMTIRLKYLPGTKPQMRILGGAVAAITNVAFDAETVPVTVTPVAAC